MSNVPLPEPDGVIAAMWNVVRHGPNYDGRQNDAIAAAKAYAERHAAAVSAAKDAEIAALRAENDKLREALAQKVVSQTMLTGLVVQDGGLTIGLEGGAAGLLVEMFAQQFKDGGGTNYLQLSFTSSVCLPGEAFIVTVQKCAGKTPHQLRMDAETEAAALRAEVAGLREDHDALLQFAKHVRRYGDTGIASMAIAVLAARKGEA